MAYMSFPKLGGYYPNNGESNGKENGNWDYLGDYVY